MRNFLRGLYAMAFGLAATACGASDQGGASVEVGATETVTQEQVRQYLLEHPELVLDDPQIGDAIRQTRLQRERTQAASQRRAILEEQADLLNSPLTPSSTPSSGDAGSALTFIEFYDYQCAPCKANYPELEQVKTTQANVRFLYAQLPIYGSHSIMASRAAIAAQLQGLFDEFHAALMTSNTRLDMDSIYLTAARVGLDVDQLRTDMRDPQVLAYLEETRLFAEALGVTGTPAFIVGDAIRRGGATAEDLKEEISRQKRRI